MNNNERIISCRQAWEEMNKELALLFPSSTQKSKLIRNFTRQIKIGNDETQYTVETDLFPKEALQVYTAWNLEDTIQEKHKKKYFSAHRGGNQGDYRQDMKKKIRNVVECLSQYPNSKRAVITIPPTHLPSHSSDDDAKCMREIHFYINHRNDNDDDDHEKDDDDAAAGETLDATVLMRAQAAEIFPKNIHFIASLMNRVAQELNVSLGNDNEKKKIKVGVLFYVATTLVSVRDD